MLFPLWKVDGAAPDHCPKVATEPAEKSQKTPGAVQVRSGSRMCPSKIEHSSIGVSEAADDAEGPDGATRYGLQGLRRQWRLLFHALRIGECHSR